MTNTRLIGASGTPAKPRLASNKPKRKFEFTSYEDTDLVDALTSRLAKMSLDGDKIYDLLDELDSARSKALYKRIELDVLESLAWLSDDPAIVEARKNLYSITKLTHQDKITEIAQEIFHRENDYDDEDYEDYEEMVKDHNSTDSSLLKNWRNDIYEIVNKVRRRVWKKKVVNKKRKKLGK